jgi:transposase
MENCSPITCASIIKSSWEPANASGSFAAWDSGGANPGRSLRKPIRKPSGLLKKLAKLAQDPSLDFWSLDECHFQQHGTRCTMWVPPEETDPVVLHAPTRKSVALFGAVNLQGGQLIAHFSPLFEGESFLAFLKGLIRRRSPGRKMVVLIDNASYHHAGRLNPWLQAHRSNFELLFLPPYSPELNPIERVWKLLRKTCTHNEYFPELELLQNALTQQLTEWWKPNPVLRRLCCIT